MVQRFDRNAFEAGLSEFVESTFPDALRIVKYDIDCRSFYVAILPDSHRTAFNVLTDYCQNFPHALDADVHVGLTDSYCNLSVSDVCCNEQTIWYRSFSQLS